MSLIHSLIFTFQEFFFSCKIYISTLHLYKKLILSISCQQVHDSVLLGLFQDGLLLFSVVMQVEVFSFLKLFVLSSQASSKQPRFDQLPAPAPCEPNKTCQRCMCTSCRSFVHVFKVLTLNVPRSNSTQQWITEGVDRILPDSGRWWVNIIVIKD